MNSPTRPHPRQNRLDFEARQRTHDFLLARRQQRMANPGLPQRSPGTKDSSHVGRLAAVKTSDIKTLSGPEVAEGIRELFNLAIGLRADFRRAEDSYRDS